MNIDIKNMSIVHWFPDTEKHRCGYCKNETGSISIGMWAETLTVEDYQDLIDRGWRRSGKYCYKPIMKETCCPQYAIKCESLNFSLSKSQKKVIKKFNKYLEDGVLNKKDIPPEAQYVDGHDNTTTFVKDCPNINFKKISNKLEEVELGQGIEENSLATGEPHNRISDSENITEEKVYDNLDSKVKIIQKAPLKDGSGPDSSRPPCKKAKLLRLERKKEKLLKCGMNFERKEPIQTQKSIEQFLEEFPQNLKHKLRLELIPTSKSSTTWEQVKEIEYELYRKYQMVVHKDPPTKLSMKGFNRFLVNSPLKPAKFPDGVDGPGFGSFHQQYWIDDELVAVGVIDILPKCVSSVYFFYDPDYKNLTLGTYGSLREVQFTRSLQKKIPELCNYYLGYYIHSCPKMRYKGKLTPSFLLCPETYRWIPIEKCLQKLDTSKYSRLEDDISIIDENVPTSREIYEIKVVYDYRLMHFRDYKKHRKDHNLFTHIGELVGKKCARRMVFCIN